MELDGILMKELPRFMDRVLIPVTVKSLLGGSQGLVTPSGLATLLLIGLAYIRPVIWTVSKA